MKYPEHEKLDNIQSQSQACGEFIEWLKGEGLILAQWHEHDEECYSHNERGQRQYLICGFTENQPIQARYNIQDLLAKYFEVDLQKLENEKLAMLNEIRAQTKADNPVRDILH